MDIAKRLKKIRNAKGYSVYKLSQLSGMSETHIRDLERGDRNPSLDTIYRIADILGLTLSEFLNENETVILDEERKAAMVSNLLVVLCGNHDAQPIVNTGSLY